PVGGSSPFGAARAVPQTSHRRSVTSEKRTSCDAVVNPTESRFISSRAISREPSAARVCMVARPIDVEHTTARAEWNESNGLDRRNGARQTLEPWNAEVRERVREGRSPAARGDAAEQTSEPGRGERERDKTERHMDPEEDERVHHEGHARRAGAGHRVAEHDAEAEAEVARRDDPQVEEGDGTGTSSSSKSRSTRSPNAKSKTRIATFEATS